MPPLEEYNYVSLHPRSSFFETPLALLPYELPWVKGLRGRSHLGEQNRWFQRTLNFADASGLSAIGRRDEFMCKIAFPRPPPPQIGDNLIDSLTHMFYFS